MGIQTVWLHIGHGKTGSSFIQSALAASIPVLDAAGLHYPVPHRIYDRARAGRVSNGNWTPQPGALRTLLGQVPPPAGATGVLLSNESLFRALFGKRQLIREVKKVFPDARIKALLFIRDPMDHMMSGYRQAVKSHGFLDSPDAFSKTYAAPALVGGCIDAAAAEGVDLTVYNYSRHQKSLLPLVEAWLGLAPDALVRPPVERVNRSLTNAEVELLRAFTRHLGKDFAHAVSVALCNRLPDVPAETPSMSAGGVRAFLDRMDGVVAEVNRRLPEGERYRLGTEADHARMIATGDEGGKNQFSDAQIEVLAAAIAARMHRQEGTPPRGRPAAGDGPAATGRKGPRRPRGPRQAAPASDTMDAPEPKA